MAATKKSLRAIKVDEVEQFFDDACVENLARIAKLPANADKQLFAGGIREAARVYTRDAREPKANELHAQITELHGAAERLLCERVASLIESLPPKVRDLLNTSADGGRLATELPPPEALRDPELRKKACVTVASLCRIGGRKVEGRMRASGKRSLSWQWTLNAPMPSRNFAKRQPEWDFVMHLQLAWLDAVGKKPPQSANAHRLGPFVLMVQRCLELVGAGYSDAAVVGHINELNRCRRSMDRRQPPVRHQL